MEHLHNILAASDIGDVLWILILLAAGAISAIVKWLGKKAAEKQTQQQRQRLQQGLQQIQQPEQDDLIDLGQAYDAQPRQTPYQPIPEPPTRAAQPVPPLQPVAYQQPAPPARRRRRPPQQPAVVLEPAGRHQISHTEVTMPSADHHDHYAAPLEIGQMGTRGAATHDVVIDLSDSEKLRQAVIFRELLGPPMALRNETQPWEI